MDNFPNVMIELSVILIPDSRPGLAGGLFREGVMGVHELFAVGKALVGNFIRRSRLVDTSLSEELLPQILGGLLGVHSTRFRSERHGVDEELFVFIGGQVEPAVRGVLFRILLEREVDVAEREPGVAAVDRDMGRAVAAAAIDDRAPE